MHSIFILMAKYFVIFPVLLLAVTWLSLPRTAKRQALLVGVAGVHHFVDIIGSLIFAAIGTQLAWLLVKRLPHRN